jgi:predicted site-specific integrase-resolvase
LVGSSLLRSSPSTIGLHCRHGLKSWRGLLRHDLHRLFAARSTRANHLTRVSKQEFNSLDAQREACDAYIVSQRHAGWIAVGEMYDDGGLSDGTMERPALKRLLEDIKAGKVQIVVVYKVDRLTRSLADFAKIVDVLDAHNASFVSVTQPFNTTTSMGRLTLNMLNSSARSPASGFAIRSRPLNAKACGWAGTSRSVTTSKIAN